MFLQEFETCFGSRSNIFAQIEYTAWTNVNYVCYYVSFAAHIKTGISYGSFADFYKSFLFA